MLWISLILSAILLLIAGLHRATAATTVAVGLCFTVATTFVGCLLPIVAVQTLLIVIVSAIGYYRDWSGMTRFAVFASGTVLFYVAFGGMTWLRLPDLRDAHPLESLEARLPKRNSLRPELSGPMESELAELENAVDFTTRIAYFNGSRRAHQLQMLHEDRVQAFVESFGFGAGRMTMMGGPVTAGSLKQGLREESSVSQPGYKPLEWLSEAAAEQIKPAATTSALQTLHMSSFLDFTYPQAFGFFKDRRHVAGFRPHQFSAVPNTEKEWKITTLELVGLVVHDQPVAYVSELLPRMDLLKSAPVRPLDIFESQGLETLRGGDTLYIRQQGASVRMLGAIRAAKQCTSCHDCERGALLGAFSYVLDKSSH